MYRDGRLAEEVTEATPFWRDDLVSFLIGCSFSFEEALAEAGVPLRHVEAGCNVPMYRTTRACAPAGRSCDCCPSFDSGWEAGSGPAIST